MKFEDLVAEIDDLTISVALAYDALNQLDIIPQVYYIDIKPKNVGLGFVQGVHGRAFTTRGRKVTSYELDEGKYPILDKIRLEMYDPSVIKPGSIVMLQANDDLVAHSGDLTSWIYSRLGARAFVTDGNVRDINKCPIQVYCEKTTPMDALNYWALTEYGIPIRVKGVDINPGDLIFADGDGVMVIPQRIEEAGFVENYADVSRKESNVREMVRSVPLSRLQMRLKAIEASGGRW